MESEPQINSILEAGKLNELRKLLIGLDLQELARLQKLVRDPHVFAEEIREWLPHSIKKLIEKGDVNIEELEPFVVEAMHKSVQKNPQGLADVLFPVMGPAIRKAVAEDMKKLIASVNTTLESGLSPQSIKWRVQALFSKRSFTEIVMAHTFVYHVRQVFFIHRETGLLLHQEIDAESVEIEADMVSAMLTAIRDFVQDSFKGKSNGSLDEIQAGELKILIEQGPFAIVAAVVEGQPPASYRTILMETVEALHFNHAVDLEKFEGHTEIFTHSARFLKNCLIKQKKEKKSKKPWPLIILLLLVCITIGTLTWQHYELHQRYRQFSTELEAMPGYYLTQIDISGKKLIIKGLRDFQASSYHDIMMRYHIDSSQFIFHAEGYLSLEDEMILLRVKQRILPPETVDCKVRDGVLYLSGAASVQWLTEALQSVKTVIGITQTDTNGMNQKSDEVIEIEPVIRSIQHNHFLFEVNVVRLDEQQQIQFDSLVESIKKLELYNQYTGTRLKLMVKTHTRKQENSTVNEQVAQKRLNQFIDLLQQSGLQNTEFKTQILFEKEETQTAPVRSVFVEVFDPNQKQP